MFRTKLLLILALLVAVTVGQANRGYSYYGTSNVRDQRPQPIYAQRPILLPGRPMPVTSPEALILPEPAVKQLELAPIYFPASQPQEPVVVDPLPVPTGKPTPVTEQPPAPKPIQPSTVVSEPLPQPGPISQLKPIWLPQLIWLPEPIWQPEYMRQPESMRQPEPKPQREPVPQTEQPKPVTATTKIDPTNVSQSPTPVVFPPHLPKSQPTEGSTIGWPNQPSVSPTTWSVATQAPPVVVTTQSHQAVTQAPGQINLDFQCKDGNGYYPVEHECDTYIECKQNRAIKHTCPDGLHFNPATKHIGNACAYPSEVKCMPGDQEQNPKPTAECPKQYGYFSMNDGDCSQYIVCHAGIATIMNCSKGLAFNPQTSSCDWPANVPQCNPNVFKDFTCPPKDDSGIIYKYRYKGQCKQFIACQLGHPRLLSCDRGLYFDDASQTCIDETHVTNCSVPSQS